MFAHGTTKGQMLGVIRSSIYSPIIIFGTPNLHPNINLCEVAIKLARGLGVHHATFPQLLKLIDPTTHDNKKKLGHENASQAEERLAKEMSIPRLSVISGVMAGLISAGCDNEASHILIELLPLNMDTVPGHVGRADIYAKAPRPKTKAHLMRTDADAIARAKKFFHSDRLYVRDPDISITILPNETSDSLKLRIVTELYRIASKTMDFKTSTFDQYHRKKTA